MRVVNHSTTHKEDMIRMSENKRLKMIRLLMPYDHSDAFDKPEIKNIWDDINRILNKHDDEVKKS